MSQDRLSQFVSSVNTDIQKNYSLVAYAFENEYDWVDVDPVRDEICKCIICGLHQAALVLTNHLLESVLKKARITNESKINKTDADNICSIFNHATSEYANEPLHGNIEYAYNKGFISEEDKKYLHYCRKRFRNAFSHADPVGTFGKDSIPASLVTIGEDSNAEIGISEVPINLFIANTPFLQGVVGCMVAKELAPEYFLKVDEIARKIRGELDGNSNMGNPIGY